MCAACVAQGAVYAGGALAALQVMAARARKRAAAGDDRRPAPELESTVTERPSG